jgi:hypothetical protein
MPSGPGRGPGVLLLGLSFVTQVRFPEPGIRPPRTSQAALDPEGWIGRARCLSLADIGQSNEPATGACVVIFWEVRCSPRTMRSIQAAGSPTLKSSVPGCRCSRLSAIRCRARSRNSHRRAVTGTPARTRPTNVQAASAEDQSQGMRSLPAAVPYVVAMLLLGQYLTKLFF